MRKIAVVGLGYVGLPLALAFGRKTAVVGFDISERRISSLKQAVDYTGEFSRDEIERSDVTYTSDHCFLDECDFIIIAYPLQSTGPSTGPDPTRGCVRKQLADIFDLVTL